MLTQNDYQVLLLSVLRARKLCPQTANVYLAKLKEYYCFCYSEGIPPEDMPREGLIEFLAQSKSTNTAGQRRAMLVTLYDMVFQQGFKLMGLPYSKPRIKIPESLSPEQIQQIFNAVSNQKQRLALKIMYALGLRISEVVKIHMKDFRQKKNTRTGKNFFELKFVAKGNKERLVPIPDETMNEIRDFIKENNISEYLFIGQSRDWYSERSINKVFNKAKAKCRITIPGSTHLLRKSRATHFIDANINDRNVMLMMGWENAKTINHYHRANTCAIKEAMDSVDSAIFNSMRQLNNQQYQRIAAA